jgi:hypothetical protein
VRVLVLILVVAAVGAAALPIDDRSAPEPRPVVAERDDARGQAAARADRERRPSRVRRARCPAAVDGCRAVSGRVLYVERVDPDGDGDLHVVVLDGSVTAPGLTAVDVRRGLRPERDPRVGDRVSAAGPVQPGSYGQSQIHALEFHVGAAR